MSCCKSPVLSQLTSLTFGLTIMSRHSDEDSSEEKRIVCKREVLEEFVLVENETEEE